MAVCNQVPEHQATYPPISRNFNIGAFTAWNGHAFYPLLDPVYYLTPFRIDGLASGSLIAVLLEDERAQARITSLAGPVFFASMVCLIGGMAIFPSFRRPANSVVFNSLGYTLVIMASASLICYTLLHEKAMVTKFLSLSGLAVLGTISYGIYLYHGIFIEVVTVQGHQLASRLLAFAAVTVCCWFSFRFYERPVIRWAHRIVKERLPRGADALEGT